MKINQFPHDYEKQAKMNAQRKVSDERSLSDSRIDNIRKGILKPVDSFTWFFGGGFIGFIIGFFVCCGVCDATEEYGVSFATWLGITVVCGIIGVIIAASVNSSRNNSEKEADNEIELEKSRCEEAIKQINDDVKNEINLYKSKFEVEAQQMSVRYSESKLATEVVDWMTNGFSKTIDASDRRSHVEKIKVPFSFKVYADKISCPLGIFDFEIKRCANLNSPLEQTALSRAIASSIQLNITMKYPKDASGTDFVLDITYDYSENYVLTSIIYTAPNGNYRSVQQW